MACVVWGGFLLFWRFLLEKPLFLLCGGGCCCCVVRSPYCVVRAWSGSLVTLLWFGSFFGFGENRGSREVHRVQRQRERESRRADQEIEEVSTGEHQVRGEREQLESIGASAKGTHRRMIHPPAHPLPQLITHLRVRPPSLHGLYIDETWRARSIVGEPATKGGIGECPGSVAVSRGGGEVQHAEAEAR